MSGQCQCVHNGLQGKGDLDVGLRGMCNRLKLLADQFTVAKREAVDVRADRTCQVMALA